MCRDEMYEGRNVEPAFSLRVVVEFTGWRM